MTGPLLVPVPLEHVRRAAVTPDGYELTLHARGYGDVSIPIDAETYRQAAEWLGAPAADLSEAATGGPRPANAVVNDVDIDPQAKPTAERSHGCGKCSHDGDSRLSGYLRDVLATGELTLDRAGILAIGTESADERRERIPRTAPSISFGTPLGTLCRYDGRASLIVVDDQGRLREVRTV